MAYTLNGESKTYSGNPEKPLLWVLREEQGLTGTKFGCGVAACGACTVHVDGVPMRSCSTPMSLIEGTKVTTIEGLQGRIAGAVTAAWAELDVVQCGYCQSGQVMSAVALLTENKAPADAEIDAAMGGNICRCATYQRIRAAIHLAAKNLKG